MGKESMIGLRDTSIEKRLKGIVAMEFEVESNNGDDGSLMSSEATTFWPVQHPTEPLEEDRPIICPMPYSSSVLKNNGLQEGRFSADIMRKRSDYSAPPRKSGGILEVTMEPPIRAVRKRHHPLGPEYRGGVAGPVRRVPPQNATMSQVLHQFNHFKS
ncbi:PREDICTED: uncharacterized protein LOC109171970 [Ipomoea nil]|uniref:uncharacterized protein LOC109171970 n=1 Tax=Ipomoea nil TaxID=35883 RepID=UPI0009018117|nr:PREDICTED: uncharacterized protein LOC109171970 [Ipomoea nil]